MVAVHDIGGPAAWASPHSSLTVQRKLSQDAVILPGRVTSTAAYSRPAVDLEVVIPARNEEKRLGTTLDATLSYLSGMSFGSAIVVVDNGSVDRTADVARARQGSQVPVHLVGCSRRGKGAAVRRGILSSSAHFVGFMDADHATPIETLDAVIPLLTTGKDAVVASRYIAANSISVEQGVHRRMGGWAFRSLAQGVVAEIADTQCGFKFFNGDVIRGVLPLTLVEGFAFDVEMLWHLLTGGHSVVEVPVVWSDAPGSTFSVLRDGWPTFRDIARMRRAREGYVAVRDR